jgi:hypothetical protein
MNYTRLFRCSNEKGYFTVSEKCSDFCQVSVYIYKGIAVLFYSTDLIQNTQGCYDIYCMYTLANMYRSDS